MFEAAWLTAFDSAVGGFVHSFRAPVLTPFFYACTLLGNTGTIVTLTTLVVLAFAVRRRFAEALLVLAVVAGGEAISVTVKHIVSRVRPPASGALIALPHDPSFPSGHSIASLLLYGVVAFLLVRRVGSTRARLAIAAVMGILVFLVGLSRVYLGVHWPSDVVGAWVIGGTWLAVCATAYTVWKRRRSSTTG